MRAFEDQRASSESECMGSEVGTETDIELDIKMGESIGNYVVRILVSRAPLIRTRSLSRA